MNFDFETDLKSELPKELSKYEIKTGEGNDVSTNLLDFLTIAKKLVVPKPRIVKYNPELLQRLDKHSRKSEIKHLELLFQRGASVNVFQSKRLFQTKFHDHLVYEWNIHHFHLSLEMDKKGQFVKQVDQLLFVYVTDYDAIFLDVDKHTEGVFGDTKWQEILHDHFYELLEPLLDPEILDISPTISKGEDRQQLWAKGYNMGMTKIRGKIFHSPGMGRATSGHSSAVTDETIKVWRWLRTVTDQFSNHSLLVCYLTAIDPLKAKFKLRLGYQTIEIYEEFTEKLILQYPKILDPARFPTKYYQNETPA